MIRQVISCARSAQIQIQCYQIMTACNKKVFPCKGTFSAITPERLVRSRQNFQRFCSYALSSDVVLDMNFQIRFFRDFTTRLPPIGLSHDGTKSRLFGLLGGSPRRSSNCGKSESIDPTVCPRHPDPPALAVRFRFRFRVSCTGLACVRDRVFSLSVS